MASAKPRSTDRWLEELKSSKKTCLVSDGKKKVHYLFTSGLEMSEDYDLKTGTMLVRRFKRKSIFGGDGKWEFEVGLSSSRGDEGNQIITECFSNPIFTRVDTSVYFQWRIRNLTYPKSNYIISCNPVEREILVKTVNKKYFKKINIPDMDRCELPFDSKALSFDHANNTLIISYKKPLAILDLEKKVFKEISNLKANEDGQVDCAQS
ncbi:Protein DPCD-like isoform X2 [Oopsacas minuta]|uniref:Protein DPCD n=1 Tax=Oopsacas minuta TaxID=111878 RepID=A0AAV7KAM2_9METZ|nr:Protein DPCD-like isoform X2 [Oopsacas minuta]